MSKMLGIVIINYKTPGLTIDCLRSLAPEIEAFSEQTHCAARTLITDNASGDGSVEKIADAIAQNHWDTWAKLLPLDRNGGFSFGNNRGIEHLDDADYVLLLNSDTLVHPGVLKTCFLRMEAETNVGAMSCKLLNPDGTLQNAARLFPTPWRVAATMLGLSRTSLEDPGWDRATERRDVNWIGGAFIFIRGSVLRKIGGLDEDFFFYGEDIEFSHRIWQSGYRVLYDPASAITHLGGSSSDPTRLPSKQKNIMLFKARYLLQRKCYGWPAAVFVRSIDIVASGLRSLRLRLTGKKSSLEYRRQRDVLSLLVHPLR